MQYNALLKEHFFKPANVFNKQVDNSSDFFIVSTGSINLGDQITLYFKFCNSSKIIQDIKFKVYGNPYLIASLSYMSSKLVKKSLIEVADFSSTELIEVFEIPTTKKYSAYMIEDILQQAVEKFKKPKY